MAPTTVLIYDQLLAYQIAAKKSRRDGNSALPPCPPTAIFPTPPRHFLAICFGDSILLASGDVLSFQDHDGFCIAMPMGRERFDDRAISDDHTFFLFFYDHSLLAVRDGCETGRIWLSDVAAEELYQGKNLKHAQCIQRPVLAFYRKVLQWNRVEVLQKCPIWGSMPAALWSLPEEEQSRAEEATGFKQTDAARWWCCCCQASLCA